MKTLRLPSGRSIPVLGQGTWKMGEDPAQRRAEVMALSLGLDLGMTLIDTAEMYGEGGAESMIADVIASRRGEVFLVSKVYPHNGTQQGVIKACDRSLRRLRTDYVDLYLLHWRGSVPLADTLQGFQALKRAGKIRDYGVSNFDQDDMVEAGALDGGDQIATDQVLYNLKRRGIEWDLLPWCRERGIPIMAYAPLEEGTMLNRPQLKSVASRLGVTPAQVALSWLIRQDGIVTIPKATDADHVRENRAALDLTLNGQDLAELDQTFSPPRKKIPLVVR